MHKLQVVLAAFLGCPLFEHGRINKRAANFVSEKIKIFVFFLAKPEKSHDAVDKQKPI